MKRFVLILVLVFSVSLITGGGILLKKGIYVDDLHMGPATFSHLSLQWQQKLNLQIESLVMDLPLKQREEVQSKQPFGLSAIDNIVPIVKWVDRLFARISIATINAGAVHGTLLYEDRLGHIELSSSLFTLQANVGVEDGFLVANIEKLESEQFQSHALGDFRFDLKEKRGSGHFTANLAGSLPLLLELNVDSQNVSFQGKENGIITTITPLVDLFGLSPNIQRWITGYLTGSRYELKSFKGDFPWGTSLHLLDSFSAEVRIENCEYTFAPGFEPIKTAYTDVVFKRGILNILPHAGQFYGQDTENSWLDINFNDFENIFLTAHIQTHAVGNIDIVNLLGYYNIPLPFVQKTGKTEVDLTLAINLNHQEVHTTASFQIEDGLIEYKSKPYRVQNALLRLQNSKIFIEKMRCSVENLFKADVNGVVDAGVGKGDFDVVLLEVNVPVGNSVLALLPSAPKTEMQIQLRPDASRVVVSASSWKVGAFSLQLGAFDMPFSFDEFSGKLPSTPLLVQAEIEESLLEVDVMGDFSLQKKQVDLHCFVKKINAKDILLTSAGMPIRIQYDDGLIIQNLEKSLWSVNAIPVTLFPASFSLNNNILSIKNEKVIYGDFIEGVIDGFYDFAVSKGEFFIDEPYLKMETLSGLLNPNFSQTIQIDGSGEHLRIFLPGLDLVINKGEDKQWAAHFKSLKAVYDYSPLLQQFKLDSGELRIASPGPGMPYSFTAEIPYSYHFLVQNGKVVEVYHVRGEISEGDIQVEINSSLSLRYRDILKISSKGIAYNLPMIFKFMKECLRPGNAKPTEEKTINAVLQATESGLYLAPDSQLAADSIALSIVDKKMDMKLSAGEGTIVTTMEGDTFSLTGEYLDDTFMNNLLPDAHVKGGRMEMAVQGQFDDFSMLVKVEDTLLEDFKTLNNILAFVNTIPSLVTFSLPTYSSSGLRVSSAMAGMRVQDGVATFETLRIESPELSLAGTGWVDFPEKEISMDFNLITQTKKNIQKIPLIGYIFAGKEKQPSITVKVTGDLMDPDVKSGMFRKVATIPFGMLYRTLALPVHLVSPMFSDDDEQLPETVPEE